MAGMRRMTIITMALLFALAGKAGVSYRTPELKRLANIVHVMESNLHPGVNYLGKYNIKVDERMMVRHVGLTLFSEEVKQMGNSLILEFVERYFLQLEHPAPNCTADMMLHADGITFSKGSWKDIHHIGIATPFSLNYQLMRYTLSWNSNGTLLSFSFPGKYQLIVGENLVEAEEHLPYDIDTTIPLFHPSVMASDLQSSSMQGYYIKKGAWYEAETINATTYFRKQDDNTFVPVIDAHFIEESVANILLCPAAAESFTYDITMHRYGFVEKRFSVPIRQWIDYCSQKGCSIYCGIESVNSKEVRATVIAVNLNLNFNHLLTITVPIETIEKGGGIVKAELNAFIPTHNIINLKGKFNPNNKKGNRIIESL